MTMPYQKPPQQKPVYKNPYEQKNNSIEAQTAVKSVTDRQIAGIPVEEDLIKMRDEWERKAFKKCL